MEFPDLGEQCSLPECKQLDFIPFRCQCTKYFCREHFLSHCLSNECDANRQIAQGKRIFDSNSIIYKCEFEKCKNSSLVEMPCEKCTKHFCIVHRFHGSCYELESESIKAERKRLEEQDLKNEETRKMIEKEVTLRLRNLENTPKAKTALKVQLMKLKSKSIGEKDIPTDDRVYFSVKKPLDPSAKPLQTSPKEVVTVIYSVAEDNLRHPVYVSKRWSLGRTIDSLSNKCSVKNENNVPNTPKIRLFRESDGLCIRGKQLEKTVESLLEDHTLVSGERVNLEYISADAVHIMDENTAYFLK